MWRCSVHDSTLSMFAGKTKNMKAMKEKSLRDACIATPKGRSGLVRETFN